MGRAVPGIGRRASRRFSSRVLGTRLKRDGADPLPRASPLNRDVRASCASASTTCATPGSASSRPPTPSANASSVICTTARSSGLVALTVMLGLAESRLASDPASAARLIAEAREEARLAVKELRELAHGIHPTLLSERGLGAALEALATRAPCGSRSGHSGIPAAVSGRVDRLLRHRRGADQCRQVRAGGAGVRASLPPGRPPPPPRGR